RRSGRPSSVPRGSARRRGATPWCNARTRPSAHRSAFRSVSTCTLPPGCTSPQSRPQRNAAVSEMLALLTPGAPLLACPVGRVPLERAHGPLDLVHGGPTLLLDRVALRDQAMAALLQVFQLLAHRVHLGQRLARRDVGLDDLLKPLPLGQSRRPGGAVDELAHLRQGVMDAALG